MALTVGQLSAPPPQAVTLQAAQRHDNKVTVLLAFSLPYLRERTWYAVMGLSANTPAGSMKSESLIAF
jgi:hypothetical protein